MRVAAFFSPRCIGLAVCLATALSVRAAAPPRPGEAPPPAVIAALKPVLEAQRKALLARDEAAIRQAVSNAIAVLGPWAGNPETETRHHPPVDKAPFAPARVRSYWLEQVAHADRKLPWVANPAGDPRTMRAGLRAAAVPLQAIARTVALVPEKKTELVRIVRAGSDWLLERQHESGVFPMPVGPARDPKDKVGRILERLLKERPELAVQGWIVDLPGDGGLQYDNGLCGAALVAAWRATGDDRCLAASKRAADWAARQPLVPNWNYNAFSVGLLAAVAQATGEANYLAAAVAKARLGVLPGQMPGGRWFDPHNACAVYHNILLRDLLTLYEALPRTDAFRPVVRDALVRGVDQAAGETIANGYAGTWTAVFARALRLLGEQAAWRDALNISVNAALAGRGPGPGFDAVPVLECCAADAQSNRRSEQ